MTTMKHRTLIIFLAVAVAAGAFYAHSRTSSDQPVDPFAPIEYRPGAYFPEGFPLHGKVELLSSPVVEAGMPARVQIRYTVGDTPLKPGTALEIWKHFTSDAGEFQISDPQAPGFLSAAVSNPAVQISPLVFSNWTQRNEPSVFPYRKTAGIRIDQGTLQEGDNVTFDLGGPQGVEMQHYEENLFNFRLALVEGAQVLGYGGDALLRVTGSRLARLRVQAPSLVRVGEGFLLEVVPQDEWGSLAKDHLNLELEITGGGSVGGRFHYQPELMHYIAPNLTLPAEGVFRLEVQSSDGKLRGLSNPIWARRHPSHRIYFGELHQHSYLHDGRGVFEELYLYARRVGLLDFGALTSHHTFITGGSGPSYHLKGASWPRDHWPDIERANRRFNGWKDLVTILGYEYSVGTNAGGHHNVFYNADSAPTAMHLNPVQVNAPIGQMIRTLQLVRRPTLVIPHVGGGPPDWSHPTDPRIERLFEIASVHGVFEESYFKHLESGLRMGVIGAGDTHTAAMGNAYPGLIYTMTNALAGVYATGKSRDEIWGGLNDRRTFATTGNIRLLMDFRVNDEPMGGELASGLNGHARLQAFVSGTAPLLRIQLLKNLRVLHTVSPARAGGNLLRVTWGDNYYQRRAAVGMTRGSLRPASGRLKLVSPLHRDQDFEIIQQDGAGISWHTAAVSGDRDGFLVDLSEAGGESLHFRLEDPEMMGTLEAEIPLERVRREGLFSWTQTAPPAIQHGYMKKMGLDISFSLECESVDAGGPLDYDLTFLDPARPQAGDFYLLRVEQLDTNKAWSSPVWVN